MIVTLYGTPRVALGIDAGEIAIGAHVEPPACVTVNVCPAIVIVPVLGEVEEFAATP